LIPNRISRKILEIQGLTLLRQLESPHNIKRFGKKVKWKSEKIIIFLRVGAKSFNKKIQYSNHFYPLCKITWTKHRFLP